MVDLSINSIEDIVHLLVFILTLTIIYINYKSNKRFLKRRHKGYLYFTSFILPLLLVMALVSFLGKEWFAGLTNLTEDITENLLFATLGISFFFLYRIEQRTIELNGVSILAIGAHPDDIELGCSGSLMKAKDSGAKVYGLTMTRGEKGTGKNGDRGKEAIIASGFMELDGYYLMDFKDTELNNYVSEMKRIIEEKIKEANITMVFTHSLLDIHSDHKAVFEATKEAARNVSLLSYEAVSTPMEFLPNYYIDISNYVRDKMKLITLHKTQSDKTYMEPEVIKGRAAHRGIQCAVSYAEAFRVYRIVK
ncbi:MAG: PIG-L family deacetylase [Nitrospira sp.]|nr:PIG-L family deacetylase [Nitrospira sp.]